MYEINQYTPIWRSKGHFGIRRRLPQELVFLCFWAIGKAQDLGGSCAFIFSSSRQEPESFLK